MSKYIPTIGIEVHVELKTKQRYSQILRMVMVVWLTL